MKQLTALKVMNSGKNVFLTGPAGSGKTYILNEFIKQQRKLNKKIAITATTGLAASHIGGTTIHSWSGISIYDTLPKRFFEKLPSSRKEIITKTDILIIDEISMLHDFRLDLVNEVCKTIRKNDLAFGGIQVVLCGDFFQLPPVNRPDTAVKGEFAFRANSWEELNLHICYLDEQFRHTDDKLIDILNSIRNQNIRQEHINLLNTRIIESSNESSTRIFSTNIDVDVINHNKLRKIRSKEYEYNAIESGDPYFIGALQKSTLASRKLKLKEGALVMAIKNSPKQKFFNGSLGVVVDFEGFQNIPVVEFINGTTTTVEMDSWELRDGETIRASISQIPLRLAWAITIHKSQGMTLESAVIDLGKAFETGMGYVALSRVKTLDQLYLKGLNDIALKVSDDALRIDRLLKESSKISENYASTL